MAVKEIDLEQDTYNSTRNTEEASIGGLDWAERGIFTIYASTIDANGDVLATYEIPHTSPFVDFVEASGSHGVIMLRVFNVSPTERGFLGDFTDEALVSIIASAATSKYIDQPIGEPFDRENLTADDLKLEFLKRDLSDLYIKNRESGSITASGGGGAATFVELTDTPVALGTAGQIPAVTAAGDALEFIDAPTGGDRTGAVSTDASLTGDGVDTDLGINSQGVRTAHIADAQVTTIQIASATIGGGNIAGLAIARRHIQDGEIINTHFGAGAVETDDIKDSAVTGAKIAGDAIGNGKIKDNAVRKENIQDLAVITSKLAEGAVTLSKIGVSTDGTADQLLAINPAGDALVFVDKITGGGTVTSDDDTLEGDGSTGSPLQIKNGGVDTQQIAGDAVTELQLAPNAVTTDKIEDNSISLDKIDIDDGSNGQIMKIVNDSLTWSSDIEGMAGGGLTSVASDNTLTGTGTALDPLSLANDAITPAKLAAEAVETAAIDDGAVHAVKIFDGAVIESKIGTGAVSLTKISITGSDDGQVMKNVNGTLSWSDAATGSGTVSSDGVTLEGDGDTLTPLKIKALGVDTAQIKNLAVSGDKIRSSTISDLQLADNAIVLSKINATGTADQVLAINSAGTALTFVDQSAGGGEGVMSETFLDLTDTPADYTASGFLRANAAGDAMEFSETTGVASQILFDSVGTDTLPANINSSATAAVNLGLSDDAKAAIVAATAEDTLQVVVKHSGTTAANHSILNFNIPIADWKRATLVPNGTNVVALASAGTLFSMRAAATTLTNTDSIVLARATGEEILITTSDITNSIIRDVTVRLVKGPYISSTFEGLSDTPDTFGTAGQVITVNSTEDGIEFTDAASADVTERTEHLEEVVGTTRGGTLLQTHRIGYTLGHEHSITGISENYLVARNGDVYSRSDDPADARTNKMTLGFENRPADDANIFEHVGLDEFEFGGRTFLTTSISDDFNTQDVHIKIGRISEDGTTIDVVSESAENLVDWHTGAPYSTAGYKLVSGIAVGDSSVVDQDKVIYVVYFDISNGWRIIYLDLAIAADGTAVFNNADAQTISLDHDIYRVDDIAKVTDDGEVDTGLVLLTNYQSSEGHRVSTLPLNISNRSAPTVDVTDTRPYQFVPIRPRPSSSHVLYGFYAEGSSDELEKVDFILPELSGGNLINGDIYQFEAGESVLKRVSELEEDIVKLQEGGGRSSVSLFDSFGADTAPTIAAVNQYVPIGISTDAKAAITAAPDYANLQVYIATGSNVLGTYDSIVLFDLPIWAWKQALEKDLDTSATSHHNNNVGTKFTRTSTAINVASGTDTITIAKFNTGDVLIATSDTTNARILNIIIRLKS